MKKRLVLFICVTIIIFVFYNNSYRNSAHKSEFSLIEAENILKETWRPIKEVTDSLIDSNLNEEINPAIYIDNKQKFINSLENRLDESISEYIIFNLFKELEDGSKDISNIYVPTIYDEEVSVKSAYVRKYKKSRKEELVIYEDGNYRERGDFYRTNIYHKNNDGKWILYSIEGIMDYKGSISYN